MAGPVPGPMYPQPPSQSGGGRRVLAKVLGAAVPPLTLGLIAFVPSLVLAIRRGTPRHWLFACLFFATTIWEWVVAATMPTDVDTTTIGQDVSLGLCLLINIIGAMVQYLVMYRPASSVPVPAPGGFPAGYAPVPHAYPHQQYPSGGYGPGPGPGPGLSQPYQRQHQQPVYPPSGAAQAPQAQPQPQPSAPVPPARPSEADRVKAELEEISELLRRQD